MMRQILFLILGCQFFQCSYAQDTFSIVALDSTTREVGSAGASCLDLYSTTYTNPAFLTDIIPDTGAVNTQSYFIQANQDNARIRMRAGDTPAQIIAWLVANDAINNPEFKQYGIVGFNGNHPSSASHTGTACITYKNHLNGSINGMYYAIQGNILKGQEILDSMEAGFRNTNGSLACRIMAAMQGANVVGADTRCSNQNTSSLFAFLQVARPTDIYGNPTLNISLKTKQNDYIEPIDSLQKLFDAANGCEPLHVNAFMASQIIQVYPNPIKDYFFVDIKGSLHSNTYFTLYDIFGRMSANFLIDKEHFSVNLNHIPLGMYGYQITCSNKILAQGKLIRE